MEKTSEWPGLEKLSSVQDMLDQNKILINEINHNHELRTPESLNRNVILIRQLNGNVAKIVQLYSELASQVDQEGNPDSLPQVQLQSSAQQVQSAS